MSNILTKIFKSTKSSLAVSPWAGTNNTYSGCDMVATITISTSKGTVTHIIGSVQTLTYSIAKNIAPVRCLGNINAIDYVDGPRTIAGSLVFTVFDHHWMNTVHDELIKLGVYDVEHYIADELPPFDVTISFANEYGFTSRLAIYGIRLANEGQTMSISDIYTENTYQYVAMDIDYMKEVSTPNGTTTTTTTTTTSSTTTSSTTETIPSTSSSTTTTTSGTSVTVTPDYSYSTISPSSYSSLTSYKQAVEDLRSSYQAQAKSYLEANPDNTSTYNQYIQEINANYESKIFAGVEYFSNTTYITT